jgi:wyosine [tRNA(Phe)-imidazoG37] synthetase (radical SAM superfamily)
MSYLFGPVPSRRLGRSLGVDLVSFKTCTLDCIYCECGCTTRKTLARAEYVPTSAVINEFAEWFAQDGHADIVTFSGSGEPTLHSHLGEITDAIKSIAHLPVCLLTNATLLFQDEVRKEAAKSDIVIPSLDAGDDDTFQRINRPPKSLSFEKYCNGLITFSHEYTGRIWLEVFIIPGINDTYESIEKIAGIAARMSSIEKIQLNTAVRTPAEPSVQPCTHEKLESFVGAFTPHAEIIAAFTRVQDTEDTGIPSTRIFDMISRRPCTIDDIISGLNLRRSEIIKYLEELDAMKRIDREERAGKTYYFARRIVRDDRGCSIK